MVHLSSGLQSWGSATVKNMSEVGIRALKQNASAVVAEAATGVTITITDRGRPVAQLTPIPASRFDRLMEAGRIRAPKRLLGELPAPESGPSLTADILSDRDDHDR
jgi:prevent-host-death family protein